MLIFVCGKGGSGKDTICSRILKDFRGRVKRLVTDTTRPQRHNETDGEDYNFITDEEFEIKALKNGGYLEFRVYNIDEHTIWKYATPVYNKNNIMLCWGSLEQYRKLRRVCGDEVFGIYLKVSPNIQLHRMLNRINVNLPFFEYDGQVIEACRRVYSDSLDFTYDVDKEFDMVVQNDFERLNNVVEGIEVEVRKIVDDKDRIFNESKCKEKRNRRKSFGYLY